MPDIKADLFEKLYFLSQKQGEAIDNDDFDLLTDLIEQKQEVMNKIDLLKVQNAACMAAHPSDDLRDLQKKIVAVDEENHNKLINRADVLNKRINQMKKEKQQVRSLYMDIGDKGNYLDRRG